MTNTCVVCHSHLNSPIYQTPRSLSITSLSEIVPKNTTVFYCDNCGHCQTNEIENIETYYSTEYKILMDSEEEDQLYSFVNGKKTFRFDHQVATLLEKVDLPLGASILDYGCAKSSTMRKVLFQRPDLKVYLFDVSDMYLPFWGKFVAADQFCTHLPPEEWKDKFDTVTSFFALEHVANPRAVLESVRSLLKPEGTFYFIVPNVYANPADFVVVDHVNHFSQSSIRFLLSVCGFKNIEIDESSHQSAFVITAQKGHVSLPAPTSQLELAGSRKQLKELALYWQNLSQKITSFDRDVSPEKVCIYGSGFYGSFIASAIPDLSRVHSFLDQNPFRAGKTHLGKPIVAPDDIPDSVNAVYVGLNPKIARDEIEKITSWRGKSLRCYYL